MLTDKIDFRRVQTEEGFLFIFSDGTRIKTTRAYIGAYIEDLTTAFTCVVRDQQDAAPIYEALLKRAERTVETPRDAMIIEARAQYTNFIVVALQNFPSTFQLATQAFKRKNKVFLDSLVSDKT